MLRPGWPLGPYPNGDYYVLLAEDLRNGSFGHPWEHFLCLFGSVLLDAITEEMNSILPQILRRGGRPGASGSLLSDAGPGLRPFDDEMM